MKKKVIVHSGLVGLNCGSTDLDITHWSFTDYNCNKCQKIVSQYWEEQARKADARSAKLMAAWDAIAEES